MSNTFKSNTQDSLTTIATIYNEGGNNDNYIKKISELYPLFESLKITSVYSKFLRERSAAVIEQAIFRRKMHVSERFARAAEQKLQFLEVAYNGIPRFFENRLTSDVSEGINSRIQ